MTYDVFISHAWRYHEPWNQMVALLDSQSDFQWRNFSMPWHDPAMTPHTEKGSIYIHNCLENQIKPVHVAIFLADVYAVKSNHKWLDFEFEVARKYNKPIIGVLPSSGQGFHDWDSLVNDVVPWDIQVIRSKMDAMLQKVDA